MQQASLEDTESIAQHKKAMSEEMAKVKPRESIVLPLMKMSYQNRWDFICNEAKSVQEILGEYPALRRLAIVCFFMYMLTHSPSSQGCMGAVCV